MIGLTFSETMSGGYHLSSAPDVDRPMHFTVRASLPSLRSVIGAFDLRWGRERPQTPSSSGAPTFSIVGQVFAQGFAEHKVLSGTLKIDPYREKIIAYHFDFEGDDHKRYSFRGQKTLSEGSLVVAITVLPGGLYDERGEEVGRALLRFDLRSDIVKFLRSFRLVRS